MDKKLNFEGFTKLIIGIIVVAIFLLGMSSNHGPTGFQRIKIWYQSKTALTGKKISILPEFKSLISNGLSEDAIYSYIVYAPDVELASSGYPITSESEVRIIFEDTDGIRNCSLDSGHFRHNDYPSLIDFGANPVISVHAIVDGTRCTPTLTIRFPKFEITQTNNHKTIALNFSALGEYTYYVIGANTYTSSRLAPERDVTFTIVTPEEMDQLNSLRQKCEEKRCLISENINNLGQK
jgi:hypothetical protein